MATLIIARLTLREAARRRLLLAVALLTVAIVLLTAWGFARVNVDSHGHPVPHAVVMTTMSGIVMLLAFMFSFVLAVGAAFLAAPAIATDVESGLVLAMLPRPIRRAEFVLGKWLGLAGLLAAYTAFAAGLELLASRIVTGYVPPHPVLAVLFLTGEGIVLLTLSLLGSTRLPPMTGGIVAIALFGMVWIAGIAQALGAAFGYPALTTGGTIASLLLPTDGLWRGAMYNLQPVIVAAVESGSGRRVDAFSAAGPPSTPYLLWAAAWLIIILSFAALSFRRRDL